MIDTWKASSCVKQSATWLCLMLVMTQTQFAFRGGVEQRGESEVLSIDKSQRC